MPRIKPTMLQRALYAKGEVTPNRRMWNTFQRDKARFQKRPLYAYVGNSGAWGEGADELVQLHGNNYYDAAKNFFYSGDTRFLDPEELEYAEERLAPFRTVANDEEFGDVLRSQLMDQERFLFGLRRGGERSKPAYISPDAYEELSDNPWRGDHDSYKWLKRNVGFEDPEGFADEL